MIQFYGRFLDFYVFKEGKSVVFCWIPSHIGIRGNEQADRAAKAALDLEISPLKVPYTDLSVQLIVICMPIGKIAGVLPFVINCTKFSLLLISALYIM